MNNYGIRPLFCLCANYGTPDCPRAMLSPGSSERARYQSIGWLFIPARILALDGRYDVVCVCTYIIYIRGCTSSKAALFDVPCEAFMKCTAKEEAFPLSRLAEIISRQLVWQRRSRF